MIKLEQLAGVVLCGGKSRRMGEEKYRLVVLGETLLQRICRIVQPEVSRILIVAAVDQQIPQSESNIEVLRDEIRDAGPLAGIAQALTYLQTTEDAPAAAFVTSCDVPLLKPELIRLLRNQLTEEFDAVVVRDSISPIPYARSTASLPPLPQQDSSYPASTALPRCQKTCEHLGCRWMQFARSIRISTAC